VLCGPADSLGSRVVRVCKVSHCYYQLSRLNQIALAGKIVPSILSEDSAATRCCGSGSTTSTDRHRLHHGLRLVLARLLFTFRSQSAGLHRSINHAERAG
jgi:hypothetical protein